MDEGMVDAAQAYLRGDGIGEEHAQQITGVTLNRGRKGERSIERSSATKKV